MLFNCFSSLKEVHVRDQRDEMTKVIWTCVVGRLVLEIFKCLHDNSVLPTCSLSMFLMFLMPNTSGQFYEWSANPCTAVLQNILERLPKTRKDGRLIPTVLDLDAASVIRMCRDGGGVHKLTSKHSRRRKWRSKIRIWEVALYYGVIAEMAWPAAHPSILFVYWFICWKQQQQQQQQPASVIIP